MYISQYIPTLCTSYYYTLFSRADTNENLAVYGGLPQFNIFKAV